VSAPLELTGTSSPWMFF